MTPPIATRIRGSVFAASIVVALVTGLLAGCSSGKPTTTPPTDPRVQSQLRQDVRSLAGAVAAHNWDQANAALTALDVDAAAAREAGKLDSNQFDRIRNAAATLAAGIGQAARPPVATPTVTVTAPSTPPSNKQGPGNGHHGHGKGNGDRNGNGNGDGGD